MLAVLVFLNVTPKLAEIVHEAYRELRPRTPAPVFSRSFLSVRLHQQHDSAARGRDLYSPVGPFRRLARRHTALDPAHSARQAVSPAGRARAQRPVSALHCQSRRDRESAAGAADAGTQAHPLGAGTPLPPGRNLRRSQRRFFHGLLGRPQLTWSQNRARRSLGHYDPAHNASSSAAFSTIRGCRDMRSNTSCITRCCI